jgi:hypothetical protein
VDSLPQMIEVRKVIAPVLIERLQHQAALELAHELGADLRFLARVLAECRLAQPIAQLLVGDVRIALQPLADRRLELELRCERCLETRHVPLLLDRFGRDVALDGFVDQSDDHVAHRVGDVARLEQFVALLVDHAALIVGDVVVFEQLLADVEVARFDAVLRLGDGAVDDRVLDRLAFGHLELLHDRAEALAAEDAQQRVFERQVEARRPGIALAPGAAAQLVVDAPRLVALGADDVQPARCDHRVVADLPFAAQALDLASLSA